MDIISTEEENEFLNFTFYLFKRNLIKGFGIDIEKTDKHKISIDVVIFYDIHPKSSFSINLTEIYCPDNWLLAQNQLKKELLNILQNTLKEKNNGESYINKFRNNVEKFLKSQV